MARPWHSRPFPHVSQPRFPGGPALMGEGLSRSPEPARMLHALHGTCRSNDDSARPKLTPFVGNSPRSTSSAKASRAAFVNSSSRRLRRHRLHRRLLRGLGSQTAHPPLPRTTISDPARFALSPTIGKARRLPLTALDAGHTLQMRPTSVASLLPADNNGDHYVNSLTEE